jgi:crotonobetainyl-CoA hydratase
VAYEFVSYEKRGRIAYVTLDRPEVMNALHYGAHVELHEVFADFAADDEVWVGIITGAGDRAFSAGNDLKVTATETEADRAGRAPLPFGGITRGYDCSKPLIAAVNGVAAGGGFEIALACDIIVAAERARFALPEPRVGLTAAAGGIHRLSRQIPLKQAMGMMLTGRFVPAEEGLRLGFVNEVVPNDELMAAAERWAGEILEGSPLSIRLTKEAVLAGAAAGGSVDDAMAADAPRWARLRDSHDVREGPLAFAEKRKPNWLGR